MVDLYLMVFSENRIMLNLKPNENLFFVEAR